MATSKGFSHHLIFDKLILINLDTKKREKNGAKFRCMKLLTSISRKQLRRPLAAASQCRPGDLLLPGITFVKKILRQNFDCQFRRNVSSAV